jgi:DNA helicase-2/ATP-dependent DNA helicase PcrA
VPDIEQLLSDLTPPQREAATHVDGPLLIIAGAGSGKTRVITRRVAFLAAQGVPPFSILAITFTNKAAGEMKSRVAAVIDRPLHDFGQLVQRWPLICTFHSLCLRILKHYAGRLGLPNNFSIFDSSDQNKLIKEAITLANIETANFAPATVHATISNAKNQLLTPEDFARSGGDFYRRNVARVYTKYQQLLDQNNALDFDDLLLRAVRAFRDHPDVLQELQERFKYILIDEYQDTNHAQYILAHALAQRHKNICVVGDPDQSIYAWRGADIQNILHFEKDYPDARVVRLEQNYRSTKRILRIASKLIAKNSMRKDKTLWTENAEGEKAQLYDCQNGDDEAAAVKQRLRYLHDQAGYDWNKMAIFYRTNALSRVMERELLAGTIPYQIARGVEFYNRKEIKDALSYLRIVSNPSDEISLRRIANFPTRSISDATLKQLSNLALINGLPLWEAMRQATTAPKITAKAARAARDFVLLVTKWQNKAYGAPRAPVPPGAAAPEEMPQAVAAAIAPGPVEEIDVASASGEIASPENSEPESAVEQPLAAQGMLFGSSEDDPFGSTDQTVLDEVEPDHTDIVDEPIPPSEPVARRNLRMSVRDIVEMVQEESGLRTYFGKKAEDDEKDPLANLDELISSAAEFDKKQPEGTLDDFLAEVSLVSDADHMEGSGGAVTLMTLHAAKGLEFPVVAIIGLEEGILPHSRPRSELEDSDSSRKPHDIEEERRLFFVGITRAQEHLILSKAAQRMLRGETKRTIPSPFLFEVPAEDINLIERGGGWPGAGRTNGTRSYGARSSSDEEAADYSPRRRSASLDTEEPIHRPVTGEYAHLRPGQLVRHQVFGLGRLREIEKINEQRTRAVVQFNQFGQKTLYLEGRVRLEAAE